MKKVCNFTVTISDGLCEYEYNFKLTKDVAIYDLAKAIAQKFDVEMPNGKLVQKEVELSEQIKDDLICNETSNQIPVRDA